MSDDKNEINEIWFNGEFSSENAGKLRKELKNLETINKLKPIMIYIDSYGGNVDALNMLIDTFNEIENEIITVCMGKAMSCGAVLLSCGDKRFISKNSRVMIHEVSTFDWGKVSELKNNLEETSRLNEGLLKLLSANTKKSLRQLKKLLKDRPDAYFNAEQSLKLGIVDYIGTPKIIEKTVYEIKAT